MHSYSGTTTASGTNRNHSDTCARSNGPAYCRRCGYAIAWCICNTKFIKFLDQEHKKALLPKKIKMCIFNKKSLIIPLRKNLHSMSGMKGVTLLKRMKKWAKK